MLCVDGPLLHAFVQPATLSTLLTPFLEGNHVPVTNVTMSSKGDGHLDADKNAVNGCVDIHASFVTGAEPSVLAGEPDTGSTPESFQIASTGSHQVVLSAEASDDKEKDSFGEAASPLVASVVPPSHHRKRVEGLVSDESGPEVLQSTSPSL